MTNKPTYNPHDIGPVCAQCGFNYLKKRPLSNRCPDCRRQVPNWLTGILIGLVLGLAVGWVMAPNFHVTLQRVIAATAGMVAVGVALWAWVVRAVKKGYMNEKLRRKYIQNLDSIIESYLAISEPEEDWVHGAEENELGGFCPKPR